MGGGTPCPEIDFLSFLSDLANHLAEIASTIWDLYLALNINLLLMLLIYLLPLFAIILSLAFRSPPEFSHSVQLPEEASQTNIECPALLSTQALPK